MTKKEESSVERFTEFAVHYYVPNWFTSSIAITAPRKDLEYLQSLQLCEDKELASIASRVLGRHLWYLSEELVSLAFMDESVSLDLKRKMVTALQKPGSQHLQKRHVLGKKENIKGKTLADFVSESSKLFFNKLSLDSSFLKVDPSKWNKRNDYNAAKEYCKTMNVVNDNSERAVALIESYNNHLTKNEDQLQYILQVVEDHRSKFPNMTKTALKTQLRSNKN